MQVVSGDFDGDGRTDLAGTGGPGWATVPVGFSRGDGSFRRTNEYVTDIPSWARTPGARLLAGDFNGDGSSDLALVGGSGWATQPVAFSQRDGRFVRYNQPRAEFAAWSRESGAQAITGDFNNDGASDIALVGGAGWSTIKIAYSLRDGNFSIVEPSAPSFAWYASRPGVMVASGDFDGDGRTDIALTGGSGWGSVPIAYANSSGGFNVEYPAPGNIVAFSTTPGVRFRAADFDGDGRDDLLLGGGSQWTVVVQARALGNRTFEESWREVGGDFGTWMTQSTPFAGDFNADGRADVALARIGAGGWSTFPLALSVLPGRVGGEYNDHRDHASLLTASSSGRFGIGYTSDKDFYRINLASTGWIVAQIAFAHSRGDIDMKLFDARGKLLESSTGISNYETISDSFPAGTYYLQVYGYAGATGIYDLSAWF